MATSPLLHPAYFGSIALWSVIVKAKALCFEYCDNYQKQTYRNRMYIAHSNGKLGLNIPVKHAKDGKRQKTAEVEIENNFHWQRDHWRSLEAGYRSSPFFEYYEDELQPFFERPRICCRPGCQLRQPDHLGRGQRTAVGHRRICAKQAAFDG